MTESATDPVQFDRKNAMISMCLAPFETFWWHMQSFSFLTSFIQSSNKPNFSSSTFRSYCSTILSMRHKLLWVSIRHNFFLNGKLSLEKNYD